MDPWLYKGDLFTTPSEDHVGFVYRLTNPHTNKQYIGKKLFWNTKTKTVTVNKKKRRKRSKVESDWQQYFGSNKNLLQDIQEHGTVGIRREILYLCETKGECSYLEAKVQFLEDALLRDDYYNEWMTLKVTRAHLKIKPGT